MKDKIIGVLMGGVSSEREISLRSGQNVAAALKQRGYQIRNIDIISRDCAAQLDGIEIAYNILHGEFGEDGGVQKILEALRVPYTGSGISSSQNCMHKVKTKRILEKNALPTPRYQMINSPADIDFPAPCVVKPAAEGSSLGVSIVKKQSGLGQVVSDTLAKYTEVFVEDFIPGIEITVGVLPLRGRLAALPVLELHPLAEFYDFAAKYTPGGTELICPARLPPEVTARVQDLAKRAYLALGCAGAARVDFVVNNREPWILEINTNPGMTEQSDLPAEARAFGLSFPDLVETILLTAAIEKY
ncbi:MAG: D-alanine--D-alanine ligase [Candidatus Margulisbacteria bacterium]|jgi:D-alanine-D-alanine ligase|nr:D-alanine--D-alanine ligase [Candidatus Margulisiibacteriota bacterium]